jgi:CheY-like chemotaxis protein
MPGRTQILIVEDSPDNMTLMSYLLNAGGYSPLGAETGGDGIAAAIEHRPPLILLDLQLPDMTGFEVAAAVREHDDQCDVVIVAVTAVAMVGDRERVLASGFDGYLSKPIEPETFVRDVEAFLPSDARSSQGGAAS